MEEAEEEGETDEHDLEAFAASLEEAEPNMSPEEYAEAEAAISEMADALVTMREAKTRLAQVQRDRGFNGPAPQPSSGKGRGGGGKSG